MFEFHGWFAIAETDSEYDNGGLALIIKDLQSLLTQTTWPSSFVDLRPLNGVYYLHLAGYTNRPSGYHEKLHEVLTFLAQRAQGSYGLLYWQDDEDDRPPGRDHFHVVVLARGTLTERFDPFLSPRIPTIESA